MMLVVNGDGALGWRAVNGEGNWGPREMTTPPEKRNGDFKTSKNIAPEKITLRFGAPGKRFGKSPKPDSPNHV